MATGTVWTAGNAKWTANMDGAGKSVAAGFMGSDGAASTDLTGTRVIWTSGDPVWATAAGQSRSQCVFPRNTVALQTVSYDLSASTLTHYAGANGTSFFPERSPGGCPCWHWPNFGVMLDDRLLINSLRVESTIGSLGFRIRGATVWLVDNPSAVPSSWNFTPIDLPPGDGGIQLVFDLIDGGDGWMYAVGATDVAERALYMARFDRTSAKKGKLDTPYWWQGSVKGFGLGVPRRFGNDFPLRQIAPANSFRVDGTIQKRASDWAQVASNGFPQANLAYSLASTSTGPFPALTNFFTPPESTALDGSGNHKYTTYSGKGHVEQTWSGKTSSDVLVSYAAAPVSPASIFTDPLGSYWPRMVQATGLT